MVVAVGQLGTFLRVRPGIFLENEKPVGVCVHACVYVYNLGA